MRFAKLAGISAGTTRAFQRITANLFKRQPNSEVERAPGARLSQAAALWEDKSVENI